VTIAIDVAVRGSHLGSFFALCASSNFYPAYHS